MWMVIIDYSVDDLVGWKKYVGPFQNEKEAGNWIHRCEWEKFARSMKPMKLESPGWNIQEKK